MGHRAVKTPWPPGCPSSTLWTDALELAYLTGQPDARTRAACPALLAPLRILSAGLARPLTSGTASSRVDGA